MLSPLLAKEYYEEDVTQHGLFYKNNDQESAVLCADYSFCTVYGRVTPCSLIIFSISVAPLVSAQGMGPPWSSRIILILVAMRYA